MKYLINGRFIYYNAKIVQAMNRMANFMPNLLSYEQLMKLRTLDKILFLYSFPGEIQELKLLKSHQLLDESFVYIKRYENNSQFIGNSEKLANKFTECFYRNENSAFDVCDGNIVSIRNLKSIH